MNGYRAENENRFLFFTTNGLDGQKVAALSDGGATLAG